MRLRLRSAVFGMILAALAISYPASAHHTCSHSCVQQHTSCVNTCNSDAGCEELCGIMFEHCNCYYCGFCP